MQSVTCLALFKLAQEKSVVELTVPVDLGHKATKQLNKKNNFDNYPMLFSPSLIFTSPELKAQVRY